MIYVYSKKNQRRTTYFQHFELSYTSSCFEGLWLWISDTPHKSIMLKKIIIVTLSTFIEWRICMYMCRKLVVVICTKQTLCMQHQALADLFWHHEVKWNFLQLCKPRQLTFFFLKSLKNSWWFSRCINEMTSTLLSLLVINLTEPKSEVVYTNGMSACEGKCACTRDTLHLHRIETSYLHWTKHKMFLCSCSFQLDYIWTK